MTLVELLVASAISTIVIIAVMLLAYHSARSFAALANYVDLDIKSRTTLDTMSSEIRQASELTTATATSLTFTGTNVVSLRTYTLGYTYDPNALTLTRTYSEPPAATQTKVMLTQCTLFRFDLFQRNPIIGTYDQFPVDSLSRPDLCKLVRLTWICSRSILGRTANTESVQSAKVVIRKG